MELNQANVSMIIEESLIGTLKKHNRYDEPENMEGLVDAVLNSRYNFITNDNGYREAISVLEKKDIERELLRSLLLVDSANQIKWSTKRTKVDVDNLIKNIKSGSSNDVKNIMISISSNNELKKLLIDNYVYGFQYNPIIKDEIKSNYNEIAVPIIDELIKLDEAYGMIDSNFNQKSNEI